VLKSVKSDCENAAEWDWALQLLAIMSWSMLSQKQVQTVAKPQSVHVGSVPDGSKPSSCLSLLETDSISYKAEMRVRVCVCVCVALREWLAL